MVLFEVPESTTSAVGVFPSTATVSNPEVAMSATTGLEVLICEVVFSVTDFPSA